MKKLLILICLICATFFTKATGLDEAAASEQITWYGIDYTETRFMNFGDYVRDETIKKNLPRWSYYPFAGSYNKMWSKKYKKELLVAMDGTNKMNEEQNYTDHLTTESFEMSKEDLQKVVDKHNISGEGYGLMYIPETFDFVGTKPAKIWAVIINNADGTIIDAQKYKHDTYGDWATGIEAVIKKHSADLKKVK